MTNVTTCLPWRVVARVHYLQQETAHNEGDEYTAKRCWALHTFIGETENVGAEVYVFVKLYAAWLMEAQPIMDTCPESNSVDSVIAAQMASFRRKFPIFKEWDDEEIMTAMLSLYRMAANAHKIEHELDE